MPGTDAKANTGCKSTISPLGPRRTTNQDELVVLCWYHHHVVVHERHFQVVLYPDRRRSDSTTPTAAPLTRRVSPRLTGRGTTTIYPVPPPMAIYPIRTFGDPVLRLATKPITEITPAVHTLASDMIETMYAAPGVGLAANQIGISRRIAVFDANDRARPPGDDQPGDHRVDR